jgi:hypothetical protein
MDPNDREEVLFSTLGNDIPSSYAISRELFRPQLQLWHFHCLACIQNVDVRDQKSAGRRTMLQTLEEDADDVYDGGLWFKQHGVIAHTARKSIVCFKKYVPWMYHLMFW